MSRHRNESLVLVSLYRVSSLFSADKTSRHRTPCFKVICAERLPVCHTLTVGQVSISWEFNRNQALPACRSNLPTALFDCARSGESPFPQAKDLHGSAWHHPLGYPSNLVRSITFDYTLQSSGLPNVTSGYNWGLLTWIFGEQRCTVLLRNSFFFFFHK